METKNQPLFIHKNTGEKDIFKPQKLIDALIRSGATQKEANQVLSEIYPQLYNGITTGKIYKIAYKHLRKTSQKVAGKYRLKKAVMDLGPSGYPFEKFIGRLLRQKGYEVIVNKIIQGKCVTHEVDVIARNHSEQIMVECKFHSEKGQKSDVKVPLYILSRFEDVKHTWEKDPQLKGLRFYGLIATNTRFTEDAKDFARCSGLKVLSWDYPPGNSLREWVDESGFYPITALHSLKKKEKSDLLEKDIVLCRELKNHQAILKEIGIQESRIQRILQEASELTGVK